MLFVSAVTVGVGAVILLVGTVTLVVGIAFFIVLTILFSSFIFGGLLGLLSFAGFVVDG